jgi:hypothetical protein
VAAEFPALAANGGFTASTRMTATQVDEFCARASNVIDAKIAGKYTTPVDSTASPKAFSLLREICCWLVYSRIAPILGLSTGDAKTSTGSKLAADPASRAEAVLKEIQSGTMKLVDAPLATSADGTESYATDNAASMPPTKFKRDGEAW